MGKYIERGISAISGETRNGEMGRGSKLNTGKILIKLAKKGQFRVKVITRIEPENENTLQTFKNLMLPGVFWSSGWVPSTCATFDPGDLGGYLAGELFEMHCALITALLYCNTRYKRT